MKRIGFVGAGKQAQCIHLPNYALIPDCEIAAITDVDFELAKRVAANMHIPGVYASHLDMIAKEKLDGIVATLPVTPMAETVILDTLAAKIPLCVEKPICASVAAGKRILAATRGNNTPLAVGYHKRSDPAAIYAKSEIERLVSSGELGAMRYARVHVSLGGDWIAGAYRSAIKGSMVIPQQFFPESDYAMFSEMAKDKFFDFIGAHSHQFDLMRYLLGDAYHISYADPTGIMFAIESEHGVPGVFEFTPYNSKNDWREYGIVCFEKGYVRVDLPTPLAINRAGTAEVFRDAGNGTFPASTFPVFPSKSAMCSQAENFIALLNGKKSTLCPMSEALESIVISQDWAIRLFPK